MAARLIMYLGNDCVIELDNLKNTSTGVFDNAATVTATLYNPDGSEMAGIAWPVTLAHAVESPDEGKYRYTLPIQSLSPVPVMTTEYRAAIAVTGSGGETALWENVEIVFKKRGIHD